jgi:hypothetical protein
MRRFVALSSIFTATLMLVVMMVLPHHHHDRHLVLAHTHCSEAPEPDAAHHEKETCEVNLFISSIVRDDASVEQHSLIPVAPSIDYPTIDMFLSAQPDALTIIVQKQTTYPPLYDPLYSAQIARIQGLRAPPSA